MTTEARIAALERRDPVATPDCPHVAIRHRDRCLRLCKLTVHIFARTAGAFGDSFARGPYPAYRGVALHLMWTTRTDTGEWLSAHEIARAVGAPNHSTVLTAIQRFCRETGQPYMQRAWTGAPRRTEVAAA